MALLYSVIVRDAQDFFRPYINNIFLVSSFFFFYTSYSTLQKIIQNIYF